MAQLNQKNESEELLVWQRPEWPYFQWDSSALLDSLVKVRHEQGRLLALAQHLAPEKKLEAAQTDLQKDIIFNYQASLTKERLCGWQASFFPTGFSGIHRVSVGEFRKKDSLLRTDQKVPSAKSLTESMKKMLTWWNESPVGLDGIIRAGIAYFWFMTVSPFEEGNSQVAVTLVDLALAQDEKVGLRAYDLKKLFESDKESLEQVLYICLRQNGDITLWLKWFFEKLLSVIQANLVSYEKWADAAFFSKKIETHNLNFRQKKLIAYLLDSEKKTGVLTNRQCVDICQTSRESIKRDLKKLVELGLIQNTKKSGRSVAYTLKIEKETK